MARIDISSAKCLYFCGVKNHERHEVAAECSVFRACILLVNSYPNVCVRSNARKGFARDTLTARIGVFICQNYKL